MCCVAAIHQRSLHSRLVAHSDPVRLFCFFFPPSAPLILDRLWVDTACDYFRCVITCVFRVASVGLSSNLVDGDVTRSLFALVHFTLHIGAGVDSVVYKRIHLIIK